MASISKDPNGNVCLQFVGGDKHRRSIRLGKINQKTANEVKLKVEHLNALAVAKLPMDADTARWVSAIGDDLAAKLAAVGLIPERRSETLGQFLNGYLDRRRADGSKPATVVTIDRVIFDLTKFFSPTTALRDIGVAEAERFKEHYQRRGLAAATVYRRLKMCKMLFDHARRVKLIADNPFADVRGKNHNPVERQHYVSEADALALIDAANPTWRIIVALARFAGLRCPSEVLSLKWEHVNFETNRMTVPSPKTEHLEGKAYRVVPIFAALRPHLEDAFELAEPGEVFVVGGSQGAAYRATTQKPGGWVNTNLRTTFEKLIRRAGLTTWPRLFHNLRASCETDQMQRHPIHNVSAWLGNTPKIALEHYLQTLEADFEKAVRGAANSGAVPVQKAVQSEADTSDWETTEPPGTPVVGGFPAVPGSSRLILSDCSDGQGGTRTHTYCYARF
jgi:integrase